MTFSEDEKKVLKSLVDKALDDVKRAEELKIGESVQYLAGEKRYEEVLKDLKEKLS